MSATPTQADRENAANYLRDHYHIEVSDAVRRARDDNHPLVLAFADARLAENERCASLADAERDFRRKCQVKALKKSEARDFETMAIACVHVASAIRGNIDSLTRPIPTDGDTL